MTSRCVARSASWQRASEQAGLRRALGLLQRPQDRTLHALQVGDYVARTLGADDSKYGKVIDQEDLPGEWLVTSGGHVFHDQETDLQIWRRP
jgi:hypothetical protein